VEELDDIVVGHRIWKATQLQGRLGNKGSYFLAIFFILDILKV
jgi:hypothetical protein